MEWNLRSNKLHYWTKFPTIHPIVPPKASTSSPQSTRVMIDNEITSYLVSHSLSLKLRSVSRWNLESHFHTNFVLDVTAANWKIGNVIFGTSGRKICQPRQDWSFIGQSRSYSHAVGTEIGRRELVGKWPNQSPFQSLRTDEEQGRIGEGGVRRPMGQDGIVFWFTHWILMLFCSPYKHN